MYRFQNIFLGDIFVRIIYGYANLFINSLIRCHLSPFFQGTEETFMAFLSKLYPKGVIHEKFKVFKLLSETHHIAHNFFSFWVCLSSSPPQLLSLLNVDPSQTRAVIIAVIKKLYNLAEDLAANHNVIIIFILFLLLLKIHFIVHHENLRWLFGI